MEVLKQLNSHFSTVGSAQPIIDVWEQMKLDKYLKKGTVEKRKKIRALMDEHYDTINEHVDRAEFPHFLIPKI